MLTAQMRPMLISETLLPYSKVSQNRALRWVKTLDMK